MKKVLAFIFAFHASFFMIHEANGQIINIPSDYPTIQQGIDAAADGDTVLVQPGRYVENIDFLGKNITVASLFLTTQDTSYISQTIIDGDSITSVVCFRNGEDSTAVLIGFTITNGRGWIDYGYGSPQHYGGGITCDYYSCPNILNTIINSNYSDWGGGGISCVHSSHPVLKNVTITQNNKGGIFCSGSNIDLLTVTIKGNSDYFGGGICGRGGCNINMQNVNITNNFANSGGGIYCRNNCIVTLKNVTLKGNSASGGGGIYCEGSTLLFDSINRCNIHSNTNGGWRANDLYSDVFNYIILDTFSVLYPTRFYAEPPENFNFDILNGKTGQVDADVYVSPQGDNANSGLTINDPFKTIHYAFSKIRADSLHQNTINLLEGTFSPSTSGEPLPVIMLDYLGISAEPQNEVILDANGQSEVIIFDSNKESYLTTTTVTGGNERGISVLNCNPVLQDLIISFNDGIGIYCINSNPYIEDVTIENNAGSGIYCDQSDPVLYNVLIKGNSADYGGGMYCIHSNPNMANVTLTGNASVYEGGGLYLNESSPVFNNDIKCNIFLNNCPESKGLGADIYSFQNDLIHVVVDTFTVMSPTDCYASPLNKFTFDILHSINDNLINADLYVSVNGNNSNTGTSSDEPFKTIQYALSRIHADSLNPHTIHLLPGTYSTGTNGERFPISLSDHISLEGSGEGETMLDADSLHGVMRFLFVKNSSVSHITLTNGYDLRGGGIYCYESSPVIKSIRVIGNYAYNDGGGVYCDKSHPIFENIFIADNHTIYRDQGNRGEGGGMFLDESNPLVVNATFTGNTAANGGGISCSTSSPVLKNVYITNNAASGIYMSAGGGLCCMYDSDPVLENVVITGNSSSWDGGGIGCHFSCSLLLKNVTISNNTAMDRGGGIFLSWASSAGLIDCICWDDSPEEVRIDGAAFPTSDITISWSDIEGGEDGIVHNQNGLVNWMEGNLVVNPLFTGTGEDPFALSEGSPCINAGNPDTTGLFLPPIDLMGNPRIWNERIDMGAYEWNNLGIDNQAGQDGNLRLSIYPNPAGEIVDLRFTLPDCVMQAGIYNFQCVSIRIIDLFGKEIKKIADVVKSPGKHTVRIDVSGLQPGVYLVRVQAGSESVTRKMVKL